MFTQYTIEQRWNLSADAVCTQNSFSGTKLHPANGKREPRRQPD